MENFVSILRAPDYVFSATEDTSFRFEEEQDGNTSPVKFDYVVGDKSAKVIVYPSGSPVKYLKLRFEGNLEHVESVLGDNYTVVGYKAFLEWRSVMPGRKLPWFCYVKGKETLACYGVKTGADSFCTWQIDTHGITLFINLTNGNDGTDLKEPLVACEVVELCLDRSLGEFNVAKQFAKLTCEKPALPKEPIFGVNNWYWAYGNISMQSVEYECDYLMKMTTGCKHRPYMIIDDGWQKLRVPGGNYIGGPWEPNEKFKDMKVMADKIHQKGAKAGVWFRPLLTYNEEVLPENVKFANYAEGQVLDPSHPYTLQRVYETAKKIRGWGFDLIKHDFTIVDIFQFPNLSADTVDYKLASDKIKFYDKTKTNATIIKNLYKAIQQGAGDAEVIGCNTVGHLTAGIHSVYRVGNDTSGRSWEWSRVDGVNSFMRLPLNNTHFNVDPDCAAFTEMVNADINLDYLEFCAYTGMVTLASVTPDILTESQMERINQIYKIADAKKSELCILDFATNSNPEILGTIDGKVVKKYDWTKVYKGARNVFEWMI